MIIVILSQQLGNQMFQYALGRHLALSGKDVKYDLSYFDKHTGHDLALPRIFNLTLPVATRAEVDDLWDERSRLGYRIRRKLFGLDPLLVYEISKECYPRPFNSRTHTMDHGILYGYWQSEKYFAPSADVIRRDFTFQEPSLRNRELSEEMASRTSVGIHVRRGDYQGLFPLLNEKYYASAMNHFNEKYGSVHFYVFSNDLSWCREHLKAEKITFVDFNSGKDSPYDMWLMTQCKHNIIANSSFSWWGAWLNAHKGKEVIAPKEWDFHLKEHPDLYGTDWIKL